MTDLRWDPEQDAFVGELDAAAEAYVDADWLASAGEERVFALVASEQDAARYVVSVARAAAAVAADGRRPFVGGAGCVARYTRELLALHASSEVPATPDIVVETRSDASSLLDSTRRVADLGTVVLAGAPASPFEFDLYPDVHVRGLRIVSVTADMEGGVPAALPEPVTVRIGEPVPDGPAWFRVVPV